MEINIKLQSEVNLVELEGDVDASSAPTLQEAVLPLVQAGSKILLNMIKVPYMSSAGLRALLSIYREATTKTANLVLVGLSEDIRDTMDITGFLEFFKVYESLEEGLAALS